MAWSEWKKMGGSGDSFGFISETTFQYNTSGESGYLKWLKSNQVAFVSNNSEIICQESGKYKFTFVWSAYNNDATSTVYLRKNGADVANVKTSTLASHTTVTYVLGTFDLADGDILTLYRAKSGKYNGMFGMSLFIEKVE